MNMNELRIGNYYWIGYAGKYAKITGFIPKSTQYEIEKGFPLSGYLIEGCEKLIGWDYRPEPIELNIDWLLKFGFADSLQNGYFVKYLIPYNENSQELNKFIRIDATNPPFIEDGEIVDYINGKEESVFIQERLKYVHQVQNLYLSLTGKEIL